MNQHSRYVATKTTLLALLAKYEIEVPMLQRDYAQGRDGKQHQAIRRQFVHTLLEMVAYPDKSLDLDFVYGTLKQGTLTLLDGQQRLTTLYLLHWYLAARSQRLTDIESQLSNFRYAIRPTSADFCRCLMKEIFDPDWENINGLGDAIINTRWFQLSWTKDPTVQGMLTMLNEIHTQFNSHEALKGSNTVNLFNQLCDPANPPVTVHFLNMENFKLTNELYIRMNARGVPLTEYENFKAWLQNFSQGIDVQVSATFWQKLDTHWTDFVWQHTPHETGNTDERRFNYVDDVLLHLFKLMALLNIALQNGINRTEKLNSEQRALINRLRQNEFVACQEWASSPSMLIENTTIATSAASLLNKQILTRLEQFLDMVSNTKNADYLNQMVRWLPQKIQPESGLSYVTWLLGMLSQKNTAPSYSDWLHFYASFLLLTQAPQHDKIDLKRWMRTTHNLIANRDTGNALDFLQALRALNTLSEGYGKDEDYFTKLAPKDIGYFSTGQLEEERFKAHLVLSTPDWETRIDEAEQHLYFNGQISFLFRLASGYTATATDLAQIPPKNIDVLKFDLYAAVSKALFNRILEKDSKDSLVHRALLTLGDYLVLQSSRLSFCRKDTASASLREENWRRIFNSPPRLTIFKELLDKLSSADLESNLQTIIDSTKKQVTDWRCYFIDYPKILEHYCIKKNLYKYPSTKDTEPPRIEVLKGERATQGTYYELRTLALYLYLQKKENAHWLEKNGLRLSNKYKVTHHDGHPLSSKPGVALSFKCEGDWNILITFENNIFNVFRKNDDEPCLSFNEPEDCRFSQTYLNEIFAEILNKE